MKYLAKLALILFCLSAVLMVTNHQGAVQKVLQVVFWLMIFCTIFYIYNLKRSKD